MPFEERARKGPFDTGTLGDVEGLGVKPFPILLVDDDVLDVKTVKRAFQKAHFPNPLFVARNGLDALDYLRHEGPYEGQREEAAPRPGLILLDLNMPKLNGIGLLRKMRADESLKVLPTVVLTTSREDRDRVESYRLGVAGYIVKPLDFPQFVHATRVLGAYWNLCELP